MSAKPVVFISHKHSDRSIAEAIARFVKNKSAGNARVYLSSSPDFEGPRFGQPLNSELRHALGESDLVILVYTDDREDWSYCMWECGVAVDPKDERHTSVVVVQCTADEPKPFGDQLRVDARDLDAIAVTSGPGLAGALLVVLGTWILLRPSAASDDAVAHPPSRNTVPAIAAFLVFAALLPWVGFVLATALAGLEVAGSGEVEGGSWLSSGCPHWPPRCTELIFEAVYRNSSGRLNANIRIYSAYEFQEKPGASLLQKRRLGDCMAQGGTR